jgi:hypothetical protein
VVFSVPVDYQIPYDPAHPQKQYTIPISVSSSVPVTLWSAALYTIVGTGLNTQPPAPVIVSLDVTGSGTVFYGRRDDGSPTATDVGNTELYYEGYNIQAFTSPPTVTSGTLGRLTVDIGDLTSGSWPLQLQDPSGGPSDAWALDAESNFVPVTLGSGHITITPVPEPGAFAGGLGLLVTVAVAWGVRRRVQQRRRGRRRWRS